MIKLTHYEKVYHHFVITLRDKETMKKYEIEVAIKAELVADNCELRIYEK